MPLSPGYKIGPYEIVALLGVGGMGEVYRARDGRLGRDVAVKVLPESLVKDGDRLHRFEQEARSVAALNHPNILAIHDVGEQGNLPYLVSELLEGHSLRVELETGALPPRKATDFAVQIARGLAAAHEKNIIHRDLKPDNVFITKDGRVKILDFGLAKLVSAANGADVDVAMMTMTSLPTEAGVVMGTVGYMAPEQVRGAAVDSRTDIFAFGAVLYEMVSGRRAFHRDTAAETMTAILKEDPPELAEAIQPVSPGLERIIRRCLEKNPEQRFQSAKDLAFALEALSGTTTSKAIAAAAGPERRAWRWIGLLEGALVGAAVVGAIAWLLWPNTAGPSRFTRVSYDRGTIIAARFAQEGKAVVYSGSLDGVTVDTYVIRADYPESAPAGLHGALLLAVSSTDQLALVVRPKYFVHKQFLGTLATVPFGGGAPREVLENVLEADWSPDGKELGVIVADPAERKARLEYPIGKVLAQGKGWISGMRISPDGNAVAYFQHPPNSDDRGDVVIVDRSGKQRTLSSGWESLENLAWSPSGKEIWFSGAENGEDYCIRAVTPSGKQRTVYCGTSPTLIHDALRNGMTLVTAEDGRVSMELVERGKTETRDLSWLDNVYNPRMSHDGSVVMFTDQSSLGGSDYSVYVRKTDGSPAVRIGGGEFGADLSGDGKSALFARADDPGRRIQIVPVGPGQPQVLHWDGFQPLWAGWFPDGQHVLFEARVEGRGNGVYMTDRNAATPRLLSTSPLGWPMISPDGRSILVLIGNKQELLSIGEDHPKEIPGVTADDFLMAWSNDPKFVYTISTMGAGYKIDRLNLETGKRDLWQAWKPKDPVGFVPANSPPAITPDGSKMIFAHRQQLSTLCQTDMLK